MASLRSSRPKRKRTLKIQLSKQELQEYLDDGYTSSDIAKDFNVSPTAIEDKMRHFGVKKRKQQRKVARRPSSPRGRSPKGSSTRLAATKSPRRSSPRRAGRPRQVSKPPAKAARVSTTQVSKSSEAVEQSSTRSSDEKEHEKEPLEETDPSFNTVVVQVIKDNPNDDLDQIHSLLKSMGFEFDKAYVEEHMQKTVSKADTTGSTDGEEKKAEAPKAEKRRRGRPKKQAIAVEVDKETSPVEGGSPEKKDESGIDKNEKESDEKEECPKDGNSLSDNKQTADTEDGTENLEQSKDGDTKEKADENTEAVRKKRPRRTRKKPKRMNEYSEVDSDGATEEKGSNDNVEPETEDKESVKPKKRGRKRKNVSNKGEGLYMTKRGRPSLQLSEENLKHCIDSGLPRQKIAEVFGTCMRSISRYLEIHKMRKSDKFCNCSDAELDEMVSKICREHPDWGQIHIQQDLAKKGLNFRRAQIRNSVRRVDPIGIELRKLNNLKRRWNRGSLKKLDSILPADGINMTSTDSFLCQPPRTGLNGLSQEDSVRLLRDIVYSSKREYVEYPAPFKTDESLGESSAESSKEPEQQSQELIQAIEMVQVKLEDGPPEDRPLDDRPSEDRPSEDRPSEEVPSEKTGEQDVLQIEEGTNPQEAAAAAAAAEVSQSQDLYWKERLHSMVMSNKRAGRQAAAQRRGPEVKIPKEELEECMALGYSSSRLADKFKTSKHNVRRHLDTYKLGKSRRFEILTDEAIDEIVTIVIRDHGVLKGRQVYDKIKEEGLQIRKDDIRKSLCRLHPKGLHRGDPSILKKSWDAVNKDAPQVAILMQEHRAVVDGNEEDVIVLDTEELAKLMNHEGGIVLVDEHGNIMGSESAVEGYHQQQQQQAHGTVATIQEGETTQTVVYAREDGMLVSSQQHHNPDGGTATVVTYQHPGNITDTHGVGEGEVLENQQYNVTVAVDSSSAAANQQHVSENGIAAGTSVGEVAMDTQAQSDAGDKGSPTEGEHTHADTPHIEPQAMESNQVSQVVLTTEESQISAIILEFNVPQEQASGEGAAHSSQDGQYTATQQHPEDVYFIQGEHDSQEVRLVMAEEPQASQEVAKESSNKEEDTKMQLPEQLPESSPAPEGGAQQSVSLTSLNTVQANQLSAQVLLELDRIAHTLQSHEVQGESVPVESQESSNP